MKIINCTKQFPKMQKQPFANVRQKQSPKRCSVKKVFLEILQNSKENTGTRVSLLIKLQAPASACNSIKKEALAQVFSCEFCEIFKNTFSYRALLVAASSSSK